MTAPCQSTCTPWAAIGDVPSACSSVDAGEMADWLQVASDVLFNLTGLRWAGSCTETVRPIGECSCGGQLHDRCACGWLPQVELGGMPLTSVPTVRVDGVTLRGPDDPEPQYRVDDWRWLVRLPDEEGRNPGWPCCQRLELPDSEAGTFSVEYVWGSPPPIGGRKMAGVLACELAKSADPSAAGCRLPKRVTTITRQGTTLAILDPMSLAKDGMTGLAEVDLWVASVLLGSRRRRGSVFDPTRSPAVRRTGT